MDDLKTIPPVTSDLPAEPEIGWKQSQIVSNGQTCSMPRVVVVCDIRLFRDALENCLTEREVSVLATCELNAAGVEVRSLKPDVIVLDGTGPDAMAAAKMFKTIIPDLAIVAVLSIQNERDFLAWMELGVCGYADQNSSATDLVASIRHALQGEVHCSPRMTALLASQLARLSAERRNVNELNELTPRELRVLELVAEGLSNKRIAFCLGISDTTTKNHVHNILAKLGLRSRAQAAVHYHRLQTLAGDRKPLAHAALSQAAMARRPNSLRQAVVPGSNDVLLSEASVIGR